MSSKKIIIIIDDNVTNLKIASNALDKDYKVFTALSGEKLFSFLKMITPDLILLDIEMPDMDGFEVFARLRANPKTAAIPVIFLTASDSLEYEKYCFAMGAADYVHKPYYPPFLRKRVGLHFQTDSLKAKNLEYEEKLKKSQLTLAKLQSRLFQSVLDLIERRDEISGGHVERTRKYVEVLLDVMIKNNIYGDIIASWEKDLVLQSTMLYDLGKFSVHDTILTKPDKLEDEEYSEVKMHPLMGAKLIDQIRAELIENTTVDHLLNYAKDFATYHHEKWDGTGYPNGLKGYNIPLPGRLMAIADVYDALITKHTYKKPCTHEEAIKIIFQGKGSHFDPVLVDAFIMVADKFHKIADRSIKS